MERARREAEDLGYAVEYRLIDLADPLLPDGDFDLVVDHAFLSRVKYIDRMVRELYRRLAPGSLLAVQDYIGPHRHQYPAAQWRAAVEVNNRLDENIRQEMNYPDLRHYLGSRDFPSVHSELVMDTVERYFQIEHRRDLGGAIGYLLLTNNTKLQGKPMFEISDAVDMVIEADERLLAASPESTLFTYCVARRDDRVLDDGQLSAWTAQEEAREAEAEAAGGTYYPLTELARLERKPAWKAAQASAAAHSLEDISGWVLLDEIARRARTKAKSAVRSRLRR